MIFHILAERRSVYDRSRGVCGFMPADGQCRFCFVTARVGPSSLYYRETGTDSGQKEVLEEDVCPECKKISKPLLLKNKGFKLCKNDLFCRLDDPCPKHG